jgi:hypothetical protein
MLSAELPDDACVVRGGLCTPERFAFGSGVEADASGRLSGISVFSAPGASIEDLAMNVRNNQIGVTTVGAVRAIGGTVQATPRYAGDQHCTVDGVTAAEASRLFTPVVPNPVVSSRRQR